MNIPGKMPDGTIKHMAVKIGSPMHKRYMRGLKRWQKDRRAQNNNFKNMMKVTKKLQRENPQ